MNRRTKIRIAVWAIAILGVIPLLATVFIWWMVSGGFAKRMLESALAEKTGLKVRIGALELRGLRQVALKDLELADQGGESLVTIPRADAELRGLGLPPSVKRLSLHGLRVRLSPKLWEGSSGGKPPFEELQIDGGTLLVGDSFVLEGLEGAVKGITRSGWETLQIKADRVNGKAIDLSAAGSLSREVLESGTQITASAEGDSARGLGSLSLGTGAPERLAIRYKYLGDGGAGASPWRLDVKGRLKVAEDRVLLEDVVFDRKTGNVECAEAAVGLRIGVHKIFMPLRVSSAARAEFGIEGVSCRSAARPMGGGVRIENLSASGGASVRVEEGAILFSCEGGINSADAVGAEARASIFGGPVDVMAEAKYEYKGDRLVIQPFIVTEGDGRPGAIVLRGRVSGLGAKGGGPELLLSVNSWPIEPVLRLLEAIGCREYVKNLKSDRHGRVTTALHFSGSWIPVQEPIDVENMHLSMPHMELEMWGMDAKMEPFGTPAPPEPEEGKAVPVPGKETPKGEGP